MCSIQLQITIIISNYHHFSKSFSSRKEAHFFICKSEKNPVIVEIVPFSRRHYHSLQDKRSQCFICDVTRRLSLSLTPLSHSADANWCPPDRTPASRGKCCEQRLSQPAEARQSPAPSSSPFHRTPLIWGAPPLFSSPSAPASRHPRCRSHL